MAGKAWAGIQVAVCVCVCLQYMQSLGLLIIPTPNV